MKSIRGVQFEDHAAQAVEALITGIEEFAGKNSWYPKYKGICFALRTPEQSKADKRKAAYLIFARVNPADHGAELIRPRCPKSGPKRSPVTLGGCDSLVRLAKDWFGEVNGMPLPADREGTGNPLVVPGGQFESKRRKH